MVYGKSPKMNNVRLLFMHMPGCPACEAATPALQEFAQQNPQISVFKVDLSVAKWKNYARWEPTKTPTYAVHIPTKLVAIKEGAMADTKELSTWVQDKLLPVWKGN
jgi:thiol-disulfide isomerase/thioredoxin